MPSPTTTPNQITTTGHTYDGTGNPTALANSANANAFNLRYDPYGAVTRLDSAGNTGGWNDNPDLFHGGVQDRATGNIKFGQRFYNPTTGNWTQQDPINAPLDPYNANHYVYAADDPINYSDLTGQCSGFFSCAGDVLQGTGEAVVSIASGVGAVASGIACETVIGCAGAVALGGASIASAGASIDSFSNL